MHSTAAAPGTHLTPFAGTHPNVMTPAGPNHRYAHQDPQAHHHYNHSSYSPTLDTSEERVSVPTEAEMARANRDADRRGFQRPYPSRAPSTSPPPYQSGYPIRREPSVSEAYHRPSRPSYSARHETGIANEPHPPGRYAYARLPRRRPEAREDYDSQSSPSYSRRRDARDDQVDDIDDDDDDDYRQTDEYRRWRRRYDPGQS